MISTTWTTQLDFIQSFRLSSKMCQGERLIILGKGKGAMPNMERRLDTYLPLYGR